MVKILICCCSGSGTSQLMQLTAQKACKTVNVEASVKHCPISEGKSIARNYDLILCAPNFLKTFDNVKDEVKVRPLKNPLSQKEIIDILKETGYVA